MWQLFTAHVTGDDLINLMNMAVEAKKTENVERRMDLVQEISRSLRYSIAKKLKKRIICSNMYNSIRSKALLLIYLAVKCLYVANATGQVN